MKNRPNILFIMADDHAANAISAYDSRLAKVFKTPNIDRIANEGCRMNNCMCTNNICTPSRACIITGLYSHVSGVRTLQNALNLRVNTFPEIMQKEGYQTAVFGKWHLHCEPQGFDDFGVLPEQGSYFDPCLIKKGNEEWMVPKKNERYPDPKGKVNKGYVSDVITDLTIDWLDKRDTKKPFMLMCHHKAPHGPWMYHPRDEHIFDNMKIPEPDSLWEEKSHRSDGSKNFGTSISDRNLGSNIIKKMSQDYYQTGKLNINGLDLKERTKVAYQKYLKDYLRTVKGIDDNVGKILDYLDENNLTDNTIIIYTSDQGMFLGEHDYYDKRWIYEEASRMPFVIRYPKEISAGTVMDSVLSNVDFAPTLLDYAGIVIPDDMQGRSFREVASGNEPASWPNIAYNRYWMHMTDHYVPAHYGIRTKEYKLIYFYGLPLDAQRAVQYQTPEGWELYDLENDPYELKNVYDDSKYTDVVRELKEKLRNMKEEIGDSDTKYPEMLELENSLY